MRGEGKGSLCRIEFWDHLMPFVFPKEAYTVLIRGWSYLSPIHLFDWQYKTIKNVLKGEGETQKKVEHILRARKIFRNREHITKI